MNDLEVYFMDKLDLALELIRRAQHERNRINTLNKMLDAARREPGYDWRVRMEIESKFGATPHKSVVNDSLKMARRILKEEYI